MLIPFGHDVIFNNTNHSKGEFWEEIKSIYLFIMYVNWNVCNTLRLHF